MDLHRTTGKPDWQPIKPSERNFFQKVAASTGGILTPPNLITSLGLAIVIYGLVTILNQHFWIGLIALAVGRLLDVVDGIVAQATQTKSPLGEAFDAAADKAGTLLTIIIFFVANLTYGWILIALLAPQVGTTLLSFYKQKIGHHIHPTRQGKLSMAFAWVGLVGLVVIKALGVSWPNLFTIGIYSLIGVSVVLGVYAFWQYSTERI